MNKSSNASQETYRCFRVRRESDKPVQRGWEDQAREDLEDGHVRVAIHYSALNYKDALAAEAHPGVAGKLPLVPGIDAVGTIGESRSETRAVGARVLVAHPDFGTRHDGGFATEAVVPASWCWPIPEGLNDLEAITLGTAGFTAAQAVDALLRGGVQPGAGDVLVTGATGGVGVMAVRLLCQLGFNVVASTGKLEREEQLRNWGVKRVQDRRAAIDSSPRPLLSAKYQGGVDTVGGDTLATLLRSTQPRGIVTACGLVGGDQLTMTVYPFILRGVSLVGIDSALVAENHRREIWRKLSAEWRLPDVTELARLVAPQAWEAEIQKILAGQIFGRSVLSWPNARS